MPVKRLQPRDYSGIPDVFRVAGDGFFALLHASVGQATESTAMNVKIEPNRRGIRISVTRRVSS
jgi:hypothetical protein